jgi:tetratricopeptide (TPR) repeat protein
LEVKRSKLLVRMGRAQDAIAGLKAIVEHDPHDEQSWAALAEAYAASNRTDEAIDALRLALEMRPGSAGHRLNLAQLFRKSGQLDQALDELTKLEQEAAADYRVPLEMGLVHRARRQWGLAQRSFERAIDLRGDSAAAHFHAGMVLKALKSYSQAAAMLQRAVDLNPHDSEALQQLAAVQALALVHGGIQNAAVTS